MPYLQSWESVLLMDYNELTLKQNNMIIELLAKICEATMNKELPKEVLNQIDLLHALVENWRRFD